MSKMSPTVFVNNAPHGGIGEIVLFGECFNRAIVSPSSGILRSYFHNVFFRQPGGVTLLAVAEPKFSAGICAVVERRSKEKMLWSNAWRVVAFMAYENSFWNSSIVKRPRIYVSPDIISERVKLPISIPISVGCPNPTRFSFVDFLPKTRLRISLLSFWYYAALIATRTRTKLTTILISLKWKSAVCAYFRNHGRIIATSQSKEKRLLCH